MVKPGHDSRRTCLLAGERVHDPQEEIEQGIWGGQVRDENIHIPPEAERHTEWTRCIMNEDIDVLFLASHTHQLGVEFTVAPFGEELCNLAIVHTPFSRSAQCEVVETSDGVIWTPGD